MSKSENRKRISRLPSPRCFPEEELEIRQRAADCGLSVGAYLLACGLGRQTRSRTDQIVINELRKLGGLQKHLFKEGQGGLSREYADILITINDAISRIASIKNE